jgi:hypothetical protein
MPPLTHGTYKDKKAVKVMVKMINAAQAMSGKKVVKQYVFIEDEPQEASPGPPETNDYDEDRWDFI